MWKKLANSATHSPIHGLTRHIWVLTAAVISLAILFLWSQNHLTFTIFLDFWRYPTNSLSQKLDYNSPNIPFSSPQNHHNVTRHYHKSDILPRHNVTAQAAHDGPPSGSIVDWVSVELDPEYSSNLLSRYNFSEWGEPNYQDSKTVEIKFLNFDETKPIVLSTGNAHEVFFEALDESGHSHCCGGDYFEIDLAGAWWRSRPPTRDYGNGTYSFILQVHPHFAGAYNLTIILLFRNFDGLKVLTSQLHVDKQLRKIPVMFSKSQTMLPDLHVCNKSDFSRDVWAGRWTRHAENNSCEISNDGRYRCLEPDHPCTDPWCNGSLGSLESNGWVYSAHCSFRIFSAIDAWNCLNNRWLFFWGDSNHVDTIRNMLFFVLGVPFQELAGLSMSFDKKFTHPNNRSRSVRITNIYNGHGSGTGNDLGLKSLSNKEHRDLLKSFFNGSSVPDTVIFNSGLHDGDHWRDIKKLAIEAEMATKFWSKMIEVKKKELKVSNFIFRSTIAAGGYARTTSFNPNKMEVFNAILLEKLRAAGLVTGVIDDFDMTWAWHFDNRCNDGQHYGRFPSKSKWSDGQIGHEYFVDLMLGHVLLNAICPI